MGSIGAVLADFARFMLFQPLKGDPARNWRAYLLVGFAITWIVGFGRYWDDPAAPLLIRSGATSIFYALALSAFIWMIVLCLRPERWSYRNVLLMVTMTAAPGLVYAIPVERFMRPDAARAANLAFLAIVATWRMALYYGFLARVAKLPPGASFVAWLLPPTIIVAVLGFFGSIDAIMRSMGGVRDTSPSAIPGSAIILFTLVSWAALPFLVGALIALALRRRRPS